jgi:hypothetical protein
MHKELAGEISKVYRKEWRRKISAKPCLEAFRITFRPPDMYLCFRVKERLEEPQTLDMIDV